MSPTFLNLNSLLQGIVLAGHKWRVVEDSLGWILYHDDRVYRRYALRANAVSDILYDAKKGMHAQIREQIWDLVEPSKDGYERMIQKLLLAMPLGQIQKILKEMEPDRGGTS